jgi:lipopolysaccharide transport system ATP-binding protein
MSDIAISIKNISKKYNLYDSPQHRLKEALHPFRKKFHREFWALKDVSFEVKKGETIGIIGRNGSGKSTLLQIICGVLQPSSGDVVANGRISALLELGAGFNPEFTGRQNVYLNGAIKGFTKEDMDEQFDDIAGFADIGEFIDQPVKTYSSGMYVRLAFAAAINIDPDILIVDEALAVGDVKFQAKCFRKFEEFQCKKKTLLFVTHSAEQIVRHCNTSVLLDNGMKLSQGEPREIVNQYMDLLFGTKAPVPTSTGEEGILCRSANTKEPENEDVARFMNEPSVENSFANRKTYNKNEYRWGNRTAAIIDYLIVSGEESDPVRCNAHDEFHLYLKIRFNKDIERPIYGVTIKTVDGVSVYGNNSRDYDKKKSYSPQRKGDLKIVHFSFKPRLNPGHYLVSVGVAEETEDEVVPLDRRFDSILMYFKNSNLATGLVDLELNFELLT